MNYEEKYNKLVNAIKVLQEANPSDIGIRNWVNDNVPELRESEDEKIRKMLIDSFTRADMGGEIYGKGVTYKQVIAWLEKQGTSYTKRDVDDAFVEGMAFAKDELEKKGEQKHALDIEIPFGAKDSELQEAIYLIPEGFHAKIEGDKVVIKKGKQKPAWSVEDTFKVQRICKYLNEAKKYYADITEVRDCIDWLKSLKQRIGG